MTDDTCRKSRLLSRCDASCSFVVCHASFVILLAIGTGAVSAFSGCTQIAQAWANLTGGDWIEPEYRLTRQPLAVIIDDSQGLVGEPRAIREAYKTISAIFAEFKVNQQVVPFEDWQRLQQSDRQYGKYSIREIGEKLGAEEVLYLDVEKFTLHAEGDAPVFKGLFSVRVKVLSTKRKADIRLWPNEESGRLVSATTAATPADGDKSAGDVATELGIRLGQEVARLFYGHRELEK